MAVTSAQTSYTTEFSSAGFAGQLADNGEFDAITGINQTGADVPFGIGVKQGAADDGFALPTASTDICKGIVLHRHTDPFGRTTTGGLGDKQAGSLLREGRVYVTVEEAVVAGDPVFMRYAAGAGGSQLGAFRKSADTATAALVKGAKYMTSAAAGAIAKMDFDASVAAS